MPVLCLAADPPSVAVVTDGGSLTLLVRAPGAVWKGGKCGSWMAGDPDPNRVT